MNNSILILILLILILLVICVLSKEHLAWEGVYGKKVLWNKTQSWYHKIAPDCHKRATIPKGQSGHPYSHRDYRECIENEMNRFVNGMSRYPRYRNISQVEWDEILSASISKVYGKPPWYGFDSKGVLTRNKAA